MALSRCMKYLVVVLQFSMITLLISGCNLLTLSPETIPDIEDVKELNETIITGSKIAAPRSSNLPESAKAYTAWQNCPDATVGTSQYISKENGFCLIYPEDFLLAPDPKIPQDGILLQKQIGSSSSIQGPQIISIRISLNGLVENLDSTQYATRWQELNQVQASSPQTINLGGYPSVLLKKMPGFISGMGAFVVTKDYRYSLFLYPQPGVIPDLDDEIQKAWNMVTESIVFFEPSGRRPFARADSVCPSITGSLHSYINLVDGYCFLYPAGFHMDPALPGRIVGGPVLDTKIGYGEVQPSLLVSLDEPALEISQHPAIDASFDEKNPAGFQETIMAGHSAYLFIETRGPWTSRRAQILTQDSVYTIIAQPWESQRYPQGMAPLNQLWDVVTGSLTFFDRWR